MRKISMLVVGVFAFSSMFAQSDLLPIDEKTGKVTYMDVVDAKGMNSTETYQILKAFAASKHFEKVSEDGTKGEFHGVLKVSYPKPGQGIEDGIVKFTAHLMAKDGRYRYIFSDFSHSSRSCEGGDIKQLDVPCAASRMSKPGWYKVRKRTDELMKEYIEELKTKVQEAAADPSKDDDW